MVTCRVNLPVISQTAGSLVVVADGIIHRCSTGYKLFGDFAVLIPDGRRLAWIEEETKGPKISPDGHRRVRWVIDGTPEPLFAGCGVTLFVSDTGHSVAYAANDGDKWFVRVNGISHPKFDAIGVDLVFSPDGKRIAYFAYTAEDRQLVIDGEGQKSIEGNLDHMLTFSPDGKRILYGVLKRDGTCHIVVDDVSGPVYDCIGSRSLDVPTDVKVELPLGALFSPDSKRVAYVAERDGQCLIVTDGVEGKTRFGSLISGFGADSHGRLHRRVRRNALMFSPDSQRVALAACSRFGTKQYAVVDDRKHTEYRGISSLSFSPDSKHIAYCAMIGIHRGWVVVVDGVEREQYDSLVTPPVYRDDGVLEFIAIKDRGLLRVQVRHND